jgi:hypothetical protein
MKKIILPITAYYISVFILNCVKLYMKVDMRREERMVQVYFGLFLVLAYILLSSGVR